MGEMCQCQLQRRRHLISLDLDLDQHSVKNNRERRQPATVFHALRQ